MIEDTPRLSFGVPVRNGEDCIARCLDSILAQDFADFEVIVSDNASTDRTREVLEDYAAKDDRVRLCPKEENVGIIENFNSLVLAARGEFFRWVGADDWLEPTYASKCIAALEADPDAILATSYFDLHRNDGAVEHAEYRGEFPDSDQPERRFARMLWFFHAGAALYEPNYSLARRTELIDTGLLQIHPNNDWILSAQLSLAGRMIHVPERLFHRGFPIGEDRSGERFRSRLHPTRWHELNPSLQRLIESLLEAVSATPLGPMQRLRCQASIFVFAAKEWRRRTAGQLRKFRREKLRLTRASLGR